MRAANGALLFVLALVSCSDPSPPEPEHSFSDDVGELTCSAAAEVEGMTCADLCDLGYGECMPNCLGQDAGAMYFVKKDTCVNANANHPGDNTCEDPIEVDANLPYVGCCC